MAFEESVDARTSQTINTWLGRAFEGRSMPPLPEALSTSLKQYADQSGNSAVIIGLRQGSQ